METKMLRWTTGVTRLDRVRNIRQRFGVTPIFEKMREARPRWKSGTGYSDYSTTIYQHRPYIWPPLRKLFNFNFAVVGVGLVLISLDYDWITEQFNSITRNAKPEASQLKQTDAHSESESSVF
ncbi:unnamed protein product [Heligmosomoides polygyrus]|uniref:Deltameth_res domain-containing protein n=1 Tax=Heligmosomoides polygyrus TaxID=6339 RepID=A0A183GMI7_HELPZ|nr:unnamed protein product [Heligmosomoides polygyrus]